MNDFSEARLLTIDLRKHGTQSRPLISRKLVKLLSILGQYCHKLEAKMNPEEDEVDLELDFYRSEEDTDDSSASEGIDVAYPGEVNDDSGGDDAIDNGDEPAAYGVVFCLLSFTNYKTSKENLDEVGLEPTTSVQCSTI